MTAESAEEQERRLRQGVSFVRTTCGVFDFTWLSMVMIRNGCLHAKPSNGHCCFVYCPNFAGRYRRDNARM